MKEKLESESSLLNQEVQRVVLSKNRVVELEKDIEIE